ncbi:MAG: hypothetical protein ABSF45_22030 [Terriglobia bacterium]
MSSFFQRFFRSSRDPRYRIFGPDPFPDFRDYAVAIEAAYMARDLSEDPSVPRNDEFFRRAYKDFCDRFYPRLEWPDWLAAVLLFGTCHTILLIAVMLSPWGVIAPHFVLVVYSVSAVRQARLNRRWQADKRRYLHARHILRQRAETWQYQ